MSRFAIWVLALLVVAGVASGVRVVGPSSGMNLNLPMVIPFCGQGGGASTDRYIGPAISLGLALDASSAACDGLDESTVGAADEIPLGLTEAYVVQGMFCELNSGTDDTVVMTLYDDTAATVVSCTITAAGGIETCFTNLDAAVAASSLLAILVDNDDDDLSAQDLFCHVFIDL